MNLDRRQFLTTSVAVGTALAAASCSSTETKASASSKLKILILGGTQFIGPSVIERAKQAGHEVTLFNRGRHNTDWFPELEKLRGDRDPKKGEGIKALAGRKWDVCLDDCGYYPRMVKASAELLAPNIDHYVYVSSISAYKSNEVEGGNEDAELARLTDPTVETMGASFENYGGLKVLCEEAAERAMPGRTTVVRPGYIVGPLDPTDRFTYWPARFDKGGEVVVPGAPSDPLQVIDVRDLGDFLVTLMENRTIDTFNACGPERRLSWGEVIETCQKIAAQSSTVRWAALETLHGLKQQVEFPIWAPYAGESKGFHTWSNARARKAGLKFHSIESTLRDTLGWFKSLPAQRQALVWNQVDPLVEQEVWKQLA